MSAVIQKHDGPQNVRMSYLDAIIQAQIEEMHRDERVIMMGVMTTRDVDESIWRMRNCCGERSRAYKART